MENEKEIQARVEFKLNEILTGVKNRTNALFARTVQTGSQKDAHFHEAFRVFQEQFIKEINMPTPYDDMAEQKRRETRDKAVDEIVEMFGRNMHGRDRERLPGRVANVIEWVQRNS